MICQAQVLHLDDDIEEEVLLQVNGVELTCFASVRPYAIKEGAFYPVELNPVIFNDYVVTELTDSSVPSVVRVGKGFAYVVTGRLFGANLESDGLIFEDNVLLRDFCHLDGKMIALRMDRIDVEFLANPHVG